MHIQNTYTVRRKCLRKAQKGSARHELTLHSITGALQLIGNLVLAADPISLAILVLKALYPHVAETCSTRQTPALNPNKEKPSPGFELYGYICLGPLSCNVAETCSTR